VLARRQQQLKLLRERQKEEEARARARELEQTAIKSKFAGAVQGRVNQVGCGRASNQLHTQSLHAHHTADASVDRRARRGRQRSQPLSTFYGGPRQTCLGLRARARDKAHCSELSSTSLELLTALFFTCSCLLPEF